MNVFLTGGTGFVGSYVLREMLEAGYAVTAIKYPGTEPVITLPEQPLWVRGTLEDDYQQHLTQCDTFVHLAAVGVNPSKATWEDCFKWNVIASLNLWIQASLAGISRFIICGSCFEYGLSGEQYEFIPVDAPLQPTGAYHSSKAAASMAALGFARDYKVEMLILRPFHIFGEGEADYRFWPSLKKAALNGEDFKMTEGMQVRDFTPVEMVAQSFCKSLKDNSLKQGQPVIRNLGTGKPQTLSDFAQYWWTKWQAKGELIKGAVPYRKNEIMRYVPLVEPITI